MLPLFLDEDSKSKDSKEKEGNEQTANAETKTSKLQGGAAPSKEKGTVLNL